jgi:uncharacterized protein (TIGR02145 family)
VNTVPPPGAASTQTWVVGTQTWSAPLTKAQSGCTETTDFGSTNPPTTAYYRSSGLYTGSGYLYNWKCVNDYATQLCPTPWHVPTRDDFCVLDKTLFGTTTCSNSSGVGQSEITATYVSLWGGVYGGLGYRTQVIGYGSQARYWSCVSESTTDAYQLYYDTGGSISPQSNHTGKNYGSQVRCVK